MRVYEGILSLPLLLLALLILLSSSFRPPLALPPLTSHLLLSSLNLSQSHLPSGTSASSIVQWDEWAQLLSGPWKLAPLGKSMFLNQRDVTRAEACGMTIP